MSKSVGNIILAKHFCEKYGADTLRYIILNSHYTQVISLQENLIQQGVDYTQKITNLLKRAKFYLYSNKINLSEKKITPSEEVRQEVIQHLSNNLNTIKVLYLLEKTVNFLNKSFDGKETPSKIKKAINDIHFILNVLGFNFDFSVYSFFDKLLIKK